MQIFAPTLPTSSSRCPGGGERAKYSRKLDVRNEKCLQQSALTCDVNKGIKYLRLGKRRKWSRVALLSRSPQKRTALGINRMAATPGVGTLPAWAGLTYRGCTQCVLSVWSRRITAGRVATPCDRSPARSLLAIAPTSYSAFSVASGS